MPWESYSQPRFHEGVGGFAVAVQTRRLSCVAAYLALHLGSLLFIVIPPNDMRLGAGAYAAPDGAPMMPM